jgi:hypothetical protein
MNWLSPFSTAIEKARPLKLPVSAYILSMVLVEVWEATKAAEENVTDNAARQHFFASMREIHGAMKNYVPGRI